MIGRALISLAIPALSGFFLVDALFKKQASGFFGALFKMCLAAGLGFGVSSMFFFIWLVVFGSSGARFESFAMVELVFLIILWAVWRSVIKDASRPLFKEQNRRSKFDIVPPIFCGILILSIADMVILSVSNPHGNWDAWAIWNMRARFIFRAGQYWADAFSSILKWSHSDYPLLLPLINARCWKYLGHESLIVPISISIFFCMATVGIMVSSLSIFCGKKRASLAGLTLLGTPFFIIHGASQYADIPLGFYILAALILFCMYDRYNKNTGLLFLAGISAGLAAWTKNEGLLFFAAIVIGQFFLIVPRSGWGQYIRRMWPFFKGALPILSILAYFKLRLAPPGDILIFEQLRAASVGILDYQKWWLNLYEFYKASINFGQWMFPFMPVLIISIILFGIKTNMPDRLSIVGSAVILSIILAGSYFIFLITPDYKMWQLMTLSLNRLFLQLWPSVIFLFFQAIALPEKIA